MRSAGIVPAAVAAAIAMVAVSGGTARAQYQRPIEVVPQRPNVITTPPNPVPIKPLTSTPSVPALPQVKPAPAVVPSPPPAEAAIKKSQPRRCWCYVLNPANNVPMRSDCREACCREGSSNERC